MATTNLAPSSSCVNEMFYSTYFPRLTILRSPSDSYQMNLMAKCLCLKNLEIAVGIAKQLFWLHKLVFLVNLIPLTRKYEKWLHKEKETLSSHLLIICCAYIHGRVYSESMKTGLKKKPDRRWQIVIVKEKRELLHDVRLELRNECENLLPVIRFQINSRMKIYSTMERNKKVIYICIYIYIFSVLDPSLESRPYLSCLVSEELADDENVESTVCTQSGNQNNANIQGDEQMTDMDKYDTVLLSLAQQMRGGVPELFDVIFSFLSRKTDFYTGAGLDEAKAMVLSAFDKHSQEAIKQATEARQRKDEQERKLIERRATQKAKEEAQFKAMAENKVKEITDAEAVEFEKKHGSQRVLSGDNKNEDIVEEPIQKEDEENDDGKMAPNAGNGADLENYQWTQTLQEVEVRIPFKVGFAIKSRDVEVRIEKAHLYVGLKGHAPVINGALKAPVKVENSAWVLEDKKNVVITLEKVGKVLFSSSLKYLRLVFLRFFLINYGFSKY
uniref:Nuclear migration protein nudC n=1 Tax=Heterorhabditis bacteriophora TaxID=37862 RepID=A0A1I7X8C6_HETBA